MRALRVITLIAALLALALATTGCCAQIIGGAAKSAAEKASGVKVDEKSGSVTVKGSGGEVTVGSGELPATFPEAVPVYDGEIKSGIESKTDKGTAYMVAIETPDSGKDVVTWYEDELNSGGWTVKTPMKTEDGGLINAENDTWNVTIAVGGGGGKSEISLAVNPK